MVDSKENYKLELGVKGLMIYSPLMVRKSVLSGKTWQDWSQKDVISSSKINFPDFNFKNMETMMVRHV